MKKALFFLSILLIGSVLFAQQKYALVIGNSNYTGISRLSNPVNDANDMEAALKGLGFTVVKVLNGNLEQMENAVLNLRRSLGGTRNTYGFFFYAGHGVQSNGENYLIPVNADNIRSESQLRDRAVSLQFVLDSLSEAGNELNMIVLDACRDNPFGWARSGSRGLSVVSHAPSGSIVMYATGANSTASDGTGRNGLFTGHLLNNLKTPGLSVFDVFDKTMGDVISLSNGTQHPELSLRYAGASRAFLGSRPVATVPPTPAPTPTQQAPKPAPTPAPAPQPAVQPTPAPQAQATQAQPTVRPLPLQLQGTWLEEKELGFLPESISGVSRRTIVITSNEFRVTDSAGNYSNFFTIDSWVIASNPNKSFDNRPFSSGYLLTGKNNDGSSSYRYIYLHNNGRRLIWSSSPNPGDNPWRYNKQ